MLFCALSCVCGKQLQFGNAMGVLLHTMLLVSIAGLCEADSEHCRIWACTGTVYQMQILSTSQILKPSYWCNENEQECFCFMCNLETYNFIHLTDMHTNKA